MKAVFLVAAVAILMAGCSPGPSLTEKAIAQEKDSDDFFFWAMCKAQIQGAVTNPETYVETSRFRSDDEKSAEISFDASNLMGMVGHFRAVCSRDEKNNFTATVGPA